MKRHFFTAVALTIATVAIAPVANAADFEPATLQQRRHEVLDRPSAKAIDDIQSARLDQLDTQSKAIEDVQAARLEALDARHKAIDNLQSARLEQLDTQNKAVEDIQTTRLDALDRRTKGRQVSTPSEISDNATLHDLVQFNRRVRNKGQKA